MPVPSSINDLSTTAGSNSPGGGEAPTTADDYIRAHASFIATLRDGKVDKAGTVTPTANQPMGGYKHTGAGTATAAGDYVVWNQTGVRFPSLGIGVGSSSWVNAAAVDLSPFAAVWGGAGGASFGYNTYFDGTNYRAKETAAAGMWNVTTTGTGFLSAVPVAGGAIQTFVPRLVVQTDGTTQIGGNTTVAGTLTATGTLSAADADLTAIDCSSIGGTTATFATAYLTAINCSSISGTSATFLDGSGVAGLNASNLASGTVPSARMSGSYDISITGSAATATSATSATNASNLVSTSTLSTYQESTFTPSATGIGSPSYIERTGKFTRIGNVVHFTIAMSWDGGTNGGSLNISGLPVASSANIHMFSVMVNRANLSFSWTGTLVAYANGTTVINLGVIAGGSSMASLLNPNAGTKEIYVSGSYLV